MKKIFLVLIGMIVFSVSLKAQDSLIVYDLSVTMNSVMAAALPGAPPAPSDSLFLSAVFRINAPDSTSEVYVKIGQTPNGSEFISKTMTVVSHTVGTYCLHWGATEVCGFRENAVAYTVKVALGSLSNVIWLTVYGKDHMGNYSEKKYFKIQ